MSAFNTYTGSVEYTVALNRYEKAKVGIAKANNDLLLKKIGRAQHLYAVIAFDKEQRLYDLALAKEAGW